jgi:hypothetical protein
MTEPDEALLYVREHWATICDEDGFPDEAQCYRRGENDEYLADDAHFYRAGQAASAERIKALEVAMRDVVEDYDWVQGGPGDRDWNVLDNTIIRARALLKEADQ